MLISLEQDFHSERDIRSYSLPIEKTQSTADEVNIFCIRVFPAPSWATLQFELNVMKNFQFFGFITECIDLFMEENKLKTEKLGLGFCFGFPVEPQSLTKGILKEWAKKFNVSGVIGEDVVALLRKSLAKKNVCNFCFYTFYVLITLSSQRGSPVRWDGSKNIFRILLLPP